MAQQLLKKGTNGYENVDPKTFTEAVKEKGSNKHLDEILSGFNSYFVSYNGSRKLSRLSIISSLRRRGLYITYILYNGNIVTEYYNGTSIDDDSWGSDDNWLDGTNRLVGDISISSNGTWVINGVDSGLPARGEKGDNPILKVSEDGSTIQYSYNCVKWYDLLEVDTITPKINISKPVELAPGSTPTVENEGDDFNVELKFGLPKSPEVNIGSTITIGEGNRAKVTNSGTKYAPILNFEIPKGDTGRGITIKGFYPDLPTLQEKITAPAIGDVYCVGTEAPYVGYVWTNVYNSDTQTATPAWQPIGEINKDTTILVNDLGDREDVAMSQKGIFELYQNIDTSFSSKANVVPDFLYSVSSDNSNSYFSHNTSWDCLIITIFDNSKNLIIEGLNGNNSITFFSDYYISNDSYILNSAIDPKLINIIPENAVRAVLSLKKSNFPNGYKDVKIKQIGAGSSNYNLGEAIGDLFINKDYALLETGFIVYAEGFSSTDYLPIDKRNDIVLEGGFRDVGSKVTPIVFYDSNKDFISCILNSENSYSIGLHYEVKKEDIPENAKYIRACVNYINTLGITPMIYGVSIGVLYTNLKKSYIDYMIENGTYSGNVYIDYNHVSNISEDNLFTRYVETDKYDSALFYVDTLSKYVEVSGVQVFSINWFSDKNISTESYIKYTTGSTSEIPENAKLGVITLKKEDNPEGYINIRVLQNNYGAFNRCEVNPLLNTLGLVEADDYGDYLVGEQIEGYKRNDGTILVTGDYVHTVYNVDSKNCYHISVSPFLQLSKIKVVQCIDNNDNVIASLIDIDKATSIDELLILPKETSKIAINWRSEYTPEPKVIASNPKYINVKDGFSLTKANESLMKVCFYGDSSKVDSDLFYIRTKYNKDKDIILLYRTNTNTLISSGYTYIGNNKLSDKEIMISSNLISTHKDSTAPLLNSTLYWNLYAQHGYVIPTITNSVGMTSSDIGAKWKDQINREYTIGNVTDSLIYLLPVITIGEEGKDNRDWRNPFGTSIQSLIHIEGGVVNEEFNVAGYSYTQLRPIMKSYDRKIMIDGKIITKAGEYYCNDFCISESQLGYDPAYIKTWFPFPVLDDAKVMVKFTWSYNFKGANCSVNTTIDIRRKVECQSYGACQQQFFLDKDNYKAMFLIPKLKPQNGIDPSRPFNSPSTSSTELSYQRNSTYLIDENDPVDRQIGYLYNESANDYLIGMAAGLSLVSGDTIKDKRIQNIPIGTGDPHERLGSFSPSNTNKFYIAAVNTAPFKDDGYNFPNTYFKEINYYVSYFDPAENEGQVYWYKDGSSYVIYAHCQSSQDRIAINLPEFMEGLKVQIVEKTDGATLHTDVISNGKLMVSYDNSSNYIVVKTV